MVFFNLQQNNYDKYLKLIHKHNDIKIKMSNLYKLELNQLDFHIFMFKCWKLNVLVYITFSSFIYVNQTFYEYRKPPLMLKM